MDRHKGRHHIGNHVQIDRRRLGCFSRSILRNGRHRDPLVERLVRHVEDQLEDVVVDRTFDQLAIRVRIRDHPNLLLRREGFFRAHIDRFSVDPQFHRVNPEVVARGDRQLDLVRFQDIDTRYRGGDRHPRRFVVRDHVDTDLGGPHPAVVVGCFHAERRSIPSRRRNREFVDRVGHRALRIREVRHESFHRHATRVDTKRLDGHVVTHSHAQGCRLALVHRPVLVGFQDFDFRSRIALHEHRRGRLTDVASTVPRHDLHLDRLFVARRLVQFLEHLGTRCLVQGAGIPSGAGKSCDSALERRFRQAVIDAIPFGIVIDPQPNFALALLRHDHGSGACLRR